MGIKERRHREKQELRCKILDAARAMFAKEGFEAVTMRALAQVIEYSPTAIYLHFKDKEALIAELCATDLAELHSTIHAIADKVKDPLQRMQEASKAFVSFALEHPTQYQVVFMMPKPKEPQPAKDLLTPPYDSAYRQLRENFQAMVEAGLLKPQFSNADLTSQVYFCGLHGIASTAITAPDCAPQGWGTPLQQAEFFIDALLHGFLK